MEDWVVENLFNGSRELQIQAATQLSKLSSKQRHRLAETGVILPLISMIQAQDFEAIEASLLALLGLAFGSERNKIRIVKSGIIPVLLELLQSESEELLELSMAALLILSSCKPNKSIIASSGAIQLLLQILNDVNNSLCSIQARVDAIATLQNLSTCHQTIPLIASSGAIYTLLQLIHGYEKPSELTEKAISLLESFVFSSEDSVSEMVRIAGALRIIVEAMEEGSPQCKEHAVGILLHICRSCRDKYRGLILMEGVMPGLLQLSVDGTWRAKNMARDLLFLLRDCSDYASTSKESRHELMEQIMQAIDADGEKVDGTTLKLVQEMINKLNI